jgi:glycosyltransferase involved in cell wall biosynthesis
MRLLSVVIPALNEAPNLPVVLPAVPTDELSEAGWEVEVIVVDNGSTDGTGEIARRLGARVVRESQRGYGHAYRAGFAAVTGEVIATGDADCTYPFAALPDLLNAFDTYGVEFMTTNRLVRANRAAMKASHRVANYALSAISRSLFRHDLRDSQSGMWLLHRHVWERLNVRSTGMAFSQEIKNAATQAGFRYLEVPIEYGHRGGEVKLNALPDGIANLRQLFEHRFRKVRSVPAPVLGDAFERAATASS